MVSATIYDIINVINYWDTNWVLFFSGILIFLITLLVAVLQSFNIDGWEFKWMLLYTIPIALLAFGSAADYFNLQNHMLDTIGEKKLPTLIPGVLDDYKEAVISNFISMIYPLIARILSEIIDLACVRIRLTSRST